MRAVPLSQLERFHQEFPGSDSRTKQKLLLQKCGKGLSWVDWAASEYAGAPDLMVSYSWDLDWQYMIMWLRRYFSGDVMVWLDILACSQHKIEEGDMEEIKRLPEVVNFAGLWHMFICYCCMHGPHRLCVHVHIL